MLINFINIIRSILVQARILPFVFQYIFMAFAVSIHNYMFLQHLLGGWWGKSFGIAPSEDVSSRRPLSIKVKKIDFEEAKKATAEAGRLFEDPDFPAIDKSIFFSRKPAKPFEWKRPMVKLMLLMNI